MSSLVKISHFLDITCPGSYLLVVRQLKEKFNKFTIFYHIFGKYAELAYVENSVDPDRIALEASCFRSTLFSKVFVWCHTVFKNLHCLK